MFQGNVLPGFLKNNLIVINMLFEKNDVLKTYLQLENVLPVSFAPYLLARFKTGGNCPINIIRTLIELNQQLDKV